MSLEWDRFIDILEISKNNVIHIVQNTSFVLEFLSHLLESLKELKNSEACFEKYPRAGSTLTLASTHPYIGYDPNIAKALLSCLLEYGKIDLSRAPNLEKFGKNSDWCITRMRRLVNASCVQHQDNSILADKILELLRLKQNSLTEDTITRLLNTCLGLIHSEEAGPVITQLFSLALPNTVVDTMHFDPQVQLIPDTFIAKIADPSNGALRKLYLNWEDTLKIKLYMHYKSLYELEILNLLETYTKQQATLSFDQLTEELSNDSLIQLTNKSTYLSNVLLDTSSHYTIHFYDWRIARLTGCLYHIMTTSLKDSVQDIFNYKPTSFQIAQYNIVYTKLLDYVYSGPLDSVKQRRDTAWCLTLAARHYIFACVYSLIEWQISGEPWSFHINALVKLINWIICPSLDHRESSSLVHFESWLQVCKGKAAFLSTSWNTLLNGNAFIITCFMICIFHFVDILSIDQKLLMIKEVLIRNQEVDEKYDQGTLCILLDYLNDIQNHREYYPPSLNLDIPKIKSYVNNVLNNK